MTELFSEPADLVTMLNLGSKASSALSELRCAQAACDRYVFHNKDSSPLNLFWSRKETTISGLSHSFRVTPVTFKVIPVIFKVIPITFEDIPITVPRLSNDLRSALVKADMDTSRSKAPKLCSHMRRMA